MIHRLPEIPFWLTDRVPAVRRIISLGRWPRRANEYVKSTAAQEARHAILARKAGGTPGLERGHGQHVRDHAGSDHHGGASLIGPVQARPQPVHAGAPRQDRPGHRRRTRSQRDRQARDCLGHERQRPGGCLGSSFSLYRVDHQGAESGQERDHSRQLGRPDHAPGSESRAGAGRLHGARARARRGDRQLPGRLLLAGRYQWRWRCEHDRPPEHDVRARFDATGVRDKIHLRRRHQPRWPDRTE